MKHLIQTGHDMNAYDKSGRTPLLRAAYHGQVEVARELIRANADVHLKVKGSGRSVLCTAAYYIYQAWVKFYLFVMFILRMGEQANREMARAKADSCWKIRGSGRTALHIAAYYGHQSLVKLFLDTNINLNEQDDEGRTALMLAAERGHSAVVAELVKAGADISLKDKKGMTAVLLAKSYDMVDQLVRDVNDLSREDRSHILWHACNVGDLSMVQSVIEAGCDVDHIHKGQTPVMMATLRGHDSIVKELILANCNANLHSEGYFSDLAVSLSLAKAIWPKALLWMVIVSGVWIPGTMYKTERIVELGLDMPSSPVWNFMMALEMSLMAVVVVLVPGEGFLKVLEFAVVCMVFPFAIGRVADLAGPVVSAVVITLMTMVLVVVASMYWEFLKTIATAVVLCVCAHVVLQIVESASFVWSLRYAAMLGAIIAFAIAVVMCLVWKRMVVALHKIVVTVLVRGLANMELFVVSSTCVRFGIKVFDFHGGEAFAGAFAVFMFASAQIPQYWRTQDSVVVIFRAAAVVFPFEAARIYIMNNGLVPLEDVTFGLVLIVLVVARVASDILTTKKSVLLKGVVMVLHLVVIVAEVYLVIDLFKEGTMMMTYKARNVRMLLNLMVVVVITTPMNAGSATALHYAAGHSHIKCGVLLAEAGGDVRAKNKRLCTPLEIGCNAFQTEVNQVLSFTTKRVIAVIGNSGHGKSTLVAALECTSNSLWKKAVNHFKKVHNIMQRTTGIEAIQVFNPKYGDALFYDFAGQSQYHGPHQSFLEAMLSKHNISATLLLLVKATEEENIITQQLSRWLQPLALMSIPITPQIVVVGSFLDKVKSKKEASEKLLRCTQSVKTELALDIQGPCLLDCRQPESKGIDQICYVLQRSYLEVCINYMHWLGGELKKVRRGTKDIKEFEKLSQAFSQVNKEPLDSYSVHSHHPVSGITKALPYNLHWILVQMRKAFSIPGLRLHEFQTWMQDNAANLPRNLPSPEEVCQDLSVAGHTLFLLNKQDPSESWLILDLPALLHSVYGTLFSGCKGIVNEFGLLHCSQLADLFPKLNRKMIEQVLSSLEFCIPIDPLLVKEDLPKLTTDAEDEGWLYFPALVSAQPCEVFPEDSDPDQLQWLCWQLRTAEKHYISARLLQTIILRLAANHVFTHKIAPSVRKHCCCVWVNGISWRSTKGVDIAVQIRDSSVVQVVGCSKAGSKRMHKYTSTIVQDIIKTTTQLSPKLEATPYIVHPYTPTLWENPETAPSDSLYPVSSLTRCISNGDDHVLSLPKEDGEHPQQKSLSQVFGWSPSLTVIQDMNFAEPLNTNAGE